MWPSDAIGNIAEPWLAEWRVGRKVGRTIYAMVGPEPSDDDELIGVMDNRTVAARCVEDHNRSLEGGDPLDFDGSSDGHA